MDFDILTFVVVASAVVFQGNADIGIPCESNADCDRHGDSYCNLHGYVRVIRGTCWCVQGFIFDYISDTCKYQCGTPPTITNGNVSYENTVADSRATYACYDGFQLNGTATIACQRLIGWGTAPKCETIQLYCPAISLGNGTINYGGFSTNSSAHASCNQGYIMIGNSIFYCDVDGLWKPTIGNCILNLGYCPVLSIANGNIAYDGRSMNSTGFATCNTGYVLNGNGVSRCDQNRSWAPVFGTCELKLDYCPVVSFANGNIAYDGRSMNSTGFATCNPGYVLNGNSVSKCDQNRSWKPVFGTCELKLNYCPVVTLHNGNIGYDGRSMNSTGIATCNPGYVLNGNGVSRCDQNGSWKPVFGICELKLDYCQAIVLDNGILIYDGFSITSSANATCDQGYGINGNKRSYCDVGGTWKPAIGICVLDQSYCPIVTLHNGNIAYDSRFMNSTGIATCNPGYVLNGNGVSKCDQNRSWKPVFGTCELNSNYCPVMNIGNGTISYEGFSINSTANVTCNKGFVINGNSSSHCAEDGTWTPMIRACILDENYCPYINLRNGKVAYNGLSINSTANLTCRRGYEINGSNVSTCGKTGTWQPAIGTCILNDRYCPVVNIGNGTINYEGFSINSTANVTCNKGFVINGNGSFHCAEDGTWTPMIRACILDENYCPYMNLRNGKVDYSGFSINSTANGTCRQGYEINGSNVSMCGRTGTWQPVIGTCILNESYCNVQPSIHNGIADVTSSAINATATITCNNGYGIVGSAELVCMITGIWHYNASCNPLDCGIPPKPGNGKVDVNTGTTFQTVAKYSCATGYDLTENETRTCSWNVTAMNVSWSGSLPSCVIKDCSSGIKYLANGKVNGSQGTKFGANVTYTCNRGYALYGDARRQCTSGGFWDGVMPRCVEISRYVVLCPTNKDSRGRVWNQTLGNTIRFQTCSIGSKGNVTRLCRIDGTWQLPVYNCIRHVIREVEAQVEIITKDMTASSVSRLLDRIVNVTTTQTGTGEGDKDLLTDAELTSLSTSLETVAGVLLEYSNNSAIDVTDVATNFIESVSNLLDITNGERWQSIKDSDSTGAENVLSAVDSFGKALRNQLKENTSINHFTIVALNLAIHVKKVEATNVFPEMTSRRPEYEWLVKTKSEISFQLNSLPTIGDGDSYFSTVVVYRNMSEILPTKTNANDTIGAGLEINGPVLALSVSPSTEGRMLSPPIRLIFQHVQESFVKPSCNFWIFSSNMGTGHWSDRGCWVNERISTREVTVCECDHLTNFAVLMSPFQQADSTSEVLRYVSIVGISVSTVFLCITVAVHVWFWKNVRGDRTTLLMNLCVALIISYVIFLAGIDRTESEVSCKFIAAMLQYIYLVVFSLMLAEGIELLLIVLVVFATKSRLRKLLSFAWVMPAITVGISLAVTQTEGYGTNSFCWLSLDNGLIWAFVGPALGIVLFNIVTLVVLFIQMFNMKSMESKTTKTKIKTSVWSLCVLVPLMGVSWVIGIFYINEDLYFMQYLFAVANGLQGVFIFLFHCILNNKVRQAYRLKSRRRSAGKESLTPNTKSTHENNGKSNSKDGIHSNSESLEFSGNDDCRDTVPEQTMEGDIPLKRCSAKPFTSGSKDIKGHKYIID